MTPEELRKKYAEKGAYTAELPAVPPAFSISLEGLEGTGKSHFVAMTCPTPIVLVNFGDRSAVPFMYQMDEERRKVFHPYDIMPPTAEGWTLASAIESLKELMEIVAVEGPGLAGGTFAIDGGSSWWGTIQQVFVAPKEEQREREGKKQVGGIIYEEANARVRGMLKYLNSLGCFLVLTHQLKQDWDANGPIPGQFSPKRNSQIPYLMEVVVRMLKVCVICSAPNCLNKDHIGRRFMGRLEKLSGNPNLEGMWVDNLDFEKLYKMQTGREWTNRS